MTKIKTKSRSRAPVAAGYRRQEPPYAVQVELAEGCQLRCSFCGLSGIRGRANDYKFMTEQTLASLMSQMVEAGWNPRVEFAMHGEPTMHPHFARMVQIARECAPKYHVMMTSNGGGLLTKPGPLAHVRSLFEAGLSVFALDDYDGVKIIDRVRAALEGHDVGAAVYEYPRDAAGNPHQRGGSRRLVFIQDISQAQSGTHSLLNNHAGAGSPPLKEPMLERCAKPFRELSVRWDGSVAICCNDWRGEYKCGNVLYDGLDAVWNGDAMGAARVALYHGRRDLIRPCSRCDAKSYRVGLLPDKYGKERLRPPDEKTMADIAAAEAGDCYTSPVPREWER